MKKIKLLISAIIVFFIGISVSYAASLSMSANKSTVVVGNTVTVTVNASGAAGWEYCLNYDTSMYTLSSTTSDTGGKCILTGSTLIGYSKVTFTLKAIKSGSSTISLTSAVMYGDDGNSINFTKGSVKLTNRTQEEIEASYSTNADLKNLGVDGYTLSPEFSKDTTSYTLEVENEVETITISGTKADSSATISGLGEKNLTEGINKFEIVVIAEKGNKKTYTIEVNRKELNPIIVTVDNKEMSIVRKVDALEVPAYYSTTEIEIQNELVPALKSEITGFVLVGLKDDNGNILLYTYDDILGIFNLYKQVGTESFVFIPIDTDSKIIGYEKTKEVEIGNIKIDAYYKDEISNIVLVYGMNASNGEKAWYNYDLVDGTFQRYVEMNGDKVFSNDIYFILTIILSIGLLLSIFLIVILLVSNSKKKKINNNLVQSLKKENELKILDEETLIKNMTKDSEELRIKEDENVLKSKKNVKGDDKKDVKSEEIEKENSLEKNDKEVKEKRTKKEIEKNKNVDDETELSQREIYRLKKGKNKKEEEILEEVIQKDILDSEILEENHPTRGNRHSRSKKD